MNHVSGQRSSCFTTSYFFVLLSGRKMLLGLFGIFGCSTWSDHWGQKYCLTVLKIPSWSELLMCMEEKLRVKGQNQLVQFSLCRDLSTCWHNLESHCVSTGTCAHDGDVMSSLFLHHCGSCVSEQISDQIGVLSHWIRPSCSPHRKCAHFCSISRHL